MFGPPAGLARALPQRVNDHAQLERIDRQEERRTF